MASGETGQVRIFHPVFMGCKRKFLAGAAGRRDVPAECVPILCFIMVPDIEQTICPTDFFEF